MGCLDFLSRYLFILLHEFPTKSIRFAHPWNNGVMEWWSDGFKGNF
jgi:hypothetical protein